MIHLSAVTTSSKPTLLGVSIVVLVFGTLVSFATIGQAGRRDPDPTGSGPMAAYLFSGAFTTLWLAILGAISISGGALGFFSQAKPVSNVYGSALKGASGHFDHENIRTVTQGIILFVVAGAASAFHRNRGLALAAAENDPNAPSKKIARTYVGVVSFISIAILIVTTLLVLYLSLEIISPHIFGGSSRSSTVKSLAELSVIFIAVGTVFLRHQSMAPKPLRLFGGEDNQAVSVYHQGDDHDHFHGHGEGKSH